MAGDRYPFADDATADFVSDGLFVPIGDHGVLLAFPPPDQTLPGVAIRSVRLLTANAAAALDRLDRESALRRKNERLSEFADLVRHDLRNPLNVATGHLELARDDQTADRL